MRSWSREQTSRIGATPADLVVAACLLSVMVYSLATTSPHGSQRAADAFSYLLALPLSVPYVFHRRYPLSSVAAMLAGFLVFAVIGYAPYPGLGVFAVLYGVVAHADRRRSVLVLAGSAVCMVIGLLVQPAGVVTAADTTSSLLAVAVAWLIGENQRNRRARWVAMEERAARLEIEREARDRQARTDERLRIAREMHDVVAHSMSVIAIQSGVGNHLLDTNPAEARRAIEVVETTSRAALTEMRRLLGVLREEDEDVATRTPAVSLQDLPALVARVRGGGLAVALTVEGALEDLPPGLDLSAYRLVQEALTNVIKHGGPLAAVVVRRTDTDVTIEVTDEGRIDGDGSRSTASPTASSTTATTGHGLVGMRERVACYDGDFSAAPRPGGGFRVAARLPLMAAVEFETPGISA